MQLKLIKNAFEMLKTAIKNTPTVPRFVTLKIDFNSIFIFIYSYKYIISTKIN